MFVSCRRSNDSRFPRNQYFSEKRPALKSSAHLMSQNNSFDNTKMIMCCSHCSHKKASSRGETGVCGLWGSVGCLFGCQSVCLSVKLSVCLRACLFPCFFVRV